MSRWLSRTLARPPYEDEHGRKGWLTPFSRAQPHRVQHVALTIPGWPALRIAFLSDLHAGSHADDVTRLGAIVGQAAEFQPDLVLHGGDFVNMQPFGGGRLSPNVISGILARLDAPLGRFAVLGNHDYTYDAAAVADALTAHDITVLDDERVSLGGIDLIGVPDARVVRDKPRTLLTAVQRPTLVLAHDPVWFADLPAGPHLMLAGHTHGGQFRFPFVGPVVNMSGAPLRWSYGLIEEGGRRLYVTSGLGTSGIPLRIGCPPDFAIIDVNR